MKDYQLGREFDLGGQGSFQSTFGGDLYLRCRNAWGELADDTGCVAVRLKLGKVVVPAVAAAEAE